MSNRWADIAYPFGGTLESFVISKDDAAVLRTSVINILLTRPGERVMNPLFGSDLTALVHEQNDDALIALIGETIREAIARWDDRIIFVDFQAERSQNVLQTRTILQDRRDPTRTSELIVPMSFSSAGVVVGAG